MKSANEEFCRAAFDGFLHMVSPATAVRWCEVPQQDEPPDYYLSLDGTQFAVEVSTIMETVSVGEISVPQATIPASLHGLVKEVEERARNEGILTGAYVVGYRRPIADFSAVRGSMKAALLDYIRRTKNLSNAPTELVLKRHGGEICSIEKVRGSSDYVAGGGPWFWKWEGEAAEQVCALLEERLADKAYKLRHASRPKILLLYDAYQFADAVMFKSCVPSLPSLSHFHSVFIVRRGTDSFMLNSENGKWR